MKKFILISAVLALLSGAAFAQKQQTEELSAILGGMVKSDRWIIRKGKAEEEFIESEDKPIELSEFLNKKK